MSTVPREPDRPTSTNAERPRIEVLLSPPDYAATVILCGEHDLATSEAVRVALAPLYGRVLVDLSGCSFIDSTVIGLFVEKARSLTRDGYALELLVAASGTNHVAYTLAQIGIGDLMPIRRPASDATSDAA
jgi:anti-anti-sigma factor